MLILMIVGCDEPDPSRSDESSSNAIILLKFKTLPDKGDETVSALIQLITQVEQEPHFVNIKLHVDPKDNTNIMLYEEWDDLSYYMTDHMNTPHLKAFQAESTNLLAGPPEISNWDMKQIFKKE